MKCLRVGHFAKDCTQVISCDFCDSPFETDHNRLLHKDSNIAQVATVNGQAPVVLAYVLRNKRQLTGSRPVAAASMVLHLKCPSTGKIVPINALPDTGATDFILDTSVADRLSLHGQNCQYTVLGHAGHETVHDCLVGEISAINPRTKKEFPMSFFAYGGPCDGMYPENWSRRKSNWGHLKALELPEPVDGKPFEAIIGCRYLALLEPEGPQDLHMGASSDEPVAKLSPLGWIVGGRTSSKVHGKITAVQSILSRVDVPAAGTLGDGAPPDYKFLYHQLKRDLERVWNLETEEDMRRLVNCYSPPLKTVAEAQAEVQLQEDLHFVTEENRYEACLLWKSSERPLSNYQKAKHLYLQLEASLKNDGDKREEFHDTHQKWIEAGFLEKAQDCPDEPHQFFLSGFMVRRETTHGVSHCFVMNGAKEFKGKSLNDFLLTGANKMNNLADVLLRFRKNPYVLTCDIQNMFLDILVKHEDRDYLNLFCRPSGNEELKVY